MSLSNIPDFLIIHRGNYTEAFYNSLEEIDYLETIDKELESRTSHFEPEYDSEGNIITGEVIGYTEDGEEIWA